jgi:RNA polymerase sigma-70 factor, ECF subfamily
VDVKTDKTEYWHKVYNEHGPAVLAYLNKRLGHRQEAEDLLQETFVRVIKAKSPLRDESKLKSYLFSVAHNLMVNFFRKRKTESLPQSDEYDEDPFERVEDVDSLAPDHKAEWMDFKDQVFYQLDQMSEQYQLAFKYGVLEGRAYNEIARKTGWSSSQVKINIHRARKKMILALRDSGYIEQE